MRRCGRWHSNVTGMSPEIGGISAGKTALGDSGDSGDGGH